MKHDNGKTLKYPYLEAGEAISWLLGLITPNPLQKEVLDPKIKRKTVPYIRRNSFLHTAEARSFKKAYQALKKELIAASITICAEKVIFIRPNHAIYWALNEGLILAPKLQQLLGIAQFKVESLKKIFPKALDEKLKIQAFIQVIGPPKFYKHFAVREITREISKNPWFAVHDESYIKEIVREINPNFENSLRQATGYKNSEGLIKYVKELIVKAETAEIDLSDDNQITQFVRDNFEKLFTENPYICPPGILNDHSIDYHVLGKFIRYIGYWLIKLNYVTNLKELFKHSTIQFYRKLVPVKIKGIMSYYLRNFSFQT